MTTEQVPPAGWRLWPVDSVADSWLALRGSSLLTIHVPKGGNLLNGWKPTHRVLTLVLMAGAPCAARFAFDGEAPMSCLHCSRHSSDNFHTVRLGQIQIGFAR